MDCVVIKEILVLISSIGLLEADSYIHFRKLITPHLIRMEKVWYNVCFLPVILSQGIIRRKLLFNCGNDVMDFYALSDSCNFFSKYVSKPES